MNQPKTPVDAMFAEPDLIRVMSSRTAYQDRKDALERLLRKAWQAGFDAARTERIEAKDEDR